MSECEVIHTVVPDSVHGEEFWLGYALNEGEYFRLRPIGSEAEIDTLMGEYKLTGYMTLQDVHSVLKYDVIKVLYAVKLQASEALRIMPQARKG